MGCTVETPKPKRRRKGLSTPRPYGELSAAAKARARDCWREKGWTWDEWDSDQLTEFFKQELDEEWGIDEAELSWSLGYCQGDGVSFTASLNLEKVAAKIDTVAEIMHKPSFWRPRPGGSIRRNGPPQSRVAASMSSAMRWITTILHGTPSGSWTSLPARWRRSLSRSTSKPAAGCEKLGYAEIEYHDSDEYMDQELTAKDFYLFTEEGEFDS